MDDDPVDTPIAVFSPPPSPQSLLQLELLRIQLREDQTELKELRARVPRLEKENESLATGILYAADRAADLEQMVKRRMNPQELLRREIARIEKREEAERVETCRANLKMLSRERTDMQKHIQELIEETTRLRKILVDHDIEY